MQPSHCETIETESATDFGNCVVDLIVLAEDAHLEPFAAYLRDALRGNGQRVWLDIDDMLSDFGIRRTTAKNLQRIAVAITLLAPKTSGKASFTEQLSKFQNSVALTQRRVVLAVNVTSPGNSMANRTFLPAPHVWVNSSSNSSVFAENLVLALNAAEEICRPVDASRTDKTLSAIELVEQQLTVSMLSLIPVAGIKSRRVETLAVWSAAAHGNTEPAQALFLDLINHSDGQPVLPLNTAACYRGAGALSYLKDEDKAIQSYRIATQIERDNAEGWFYLGCLLHGAGKFDEAITAFQQIISIPDLHLSKDFLILAHESLGHIRQNQKRFDDAETHYRRAIDAAVKDNNLELAATLHLGVAKLLLKRFIDGENPTGRYNFRIRHKSDLDSALRLASKSSDPFFLADLHMAIADLYVQYGEDGEANDAWNKAERLYSKLGSRTGSGRIAQRRREVDEAYKTRSTLVKALFALITSGLSLLGR